MGARVLRIMKNKLRIKKYVPNGADPAGIACSGRPWYLAWALPNVQFCDHFATFAEAARCAWNLQGGRPL